MKRAKELQVSEQFVFNGIRWVVVEKDECTGDVWCKPIFKNSYEEFLQTPFMKEFMKPLYDFGKEEEDEQ